MLLQKPIPYVLPPDVGGVDPGSCLVDELKTFEVQEEGGTSIGVEKKVHQRRTEELQLESLVEEDEVVGTGDETWSEEWWCPPGDAEERP